MAERSSERERRGSPQSTLGTDERGVSPVVGKSLELGLVVLFLGMMTTALYGGVVPNYRTAAASEVGDRAVVAAAERIETAIPPNATRVHAEIGVDLPATLRGRGYRVRARNDTLVLAHPNDAVDARTRLALPSAVGNVSGTWNSGGDTVVVVDSGESGGGAGAGSGDDAASHGLWVRLVTRR